MQNLRLPCDDSYEDSFQQVRFKDNQPTNKEHSGASFILVTNSFFHFPDGPHDVDPVRDRLYRGR